MFARTSLKDGVEGFEIDELIDAILPRETGNKLGPMFCQPPNEIVGHADIQRPIWFTRENIDKERRAYCLARPGSAFRLGHQAVGPGSAEQRKTRCTASGT
jgi:hypothetical protein